MISGLGDGGFDPPLFRPFPSMIPPWKST